MDVSLKNTQEIELKDIDFLDEEADDNRALRIALIIMSVFALLCVLIVVIKLKFTITTVEVTGNEHYTTEEIADMVCASDLEKNSIFTYTTIFIEGVLIDCKTSNKIRLFF